MFLNFSAGDAAPLLWRHTTGLTVNAYLMDASTNLWWDGSAWGASPTALSTSEIGSTGIYQYVLPSDLSGHFYVYMNEGTNYQDFQIFLGKIAGTTDTAFCEVYGYVKDGSGTPISGAEINARLLPLVVDGNTAFGVKLTYVRTDSDGYFAIKLKRGENYVLDIPVSTYNKEVSIPDAASVELEAL